VKQLSERVAVVTGSATGIGFAIAQRLAAEGARVLCADIDRDGLDAAVNRLQGDGQQVVGHPCDVSDAGQVEELMARAAELDGPHILVSNAAIQFEGLIEETTPEDWDRVFSVNVRGVFLAARAAIPLMRSAGSGSIINMASVNGFWAEPQLTAYCAAKGAVIALTKAIAVEVGRHGIRCNSICPGYIDTGMARRYIDVQADPEAARHNAEQMHALGRLGLPEEIAAMAHYLASDDSSFCTGQQFVVDGGLTAGASN